MKKPTETEGFTEELGAVSSHSLLKLSARRRLVWDLLRDTDDYYLNHHFFLVDFTGIEAIRGAFEKAGRPRPSYVCLTMYAISRVLPKHSRFNSYLRVFPRPALAVFRGVDLAYTVEGERDGRNTLTLSVLRNCDTMGFEAFLQAFNGQKAAGAGGTEHQKVIDLIASVPAFARTALFRLFCKPFPEVMRKIAGTAAFTSVGRHGVDFTAPLSPKSATFSLGAVKPRPMVEGGSVVPRMSGYLTITYDHRVADGSHCAKLGADLRCFIENDLSKHAMGSLEDPCPIKS